MYLLFLWHPLDFFSVFSNLWYLTLDSHEELAIQTCSGGQKIMYFLVGEQVLQLQNWRINFKNLHPTE